MKTQALNLKLGDILISGAIVVNNPKLIQKKYLRIGLKYPNGTTIFKLIPKSNLVTLKPI